MLRMTPAHVVHAGFGRVLRGGPYCTNVFDKSVQSHMLWSHGWALAKVMMLFVVCNGFPVRQRRFVSPPTSWSELQIDARLLADATYMRRSDVCGVDHLLQRRV
ncbi:unnamed protein product [Symbiodinium microadriaticum]|nr:unnamed protein product [Symbiodinium microadriaticum]